MITDIKQMYRRVHINDEHNSLQYILWRDHPNKPLQCLQLQTVTWGLKSSSYLATRCLIQLANEYKSSFPLAANALIYNRYVDDILCGSNNLVKAEQIQKELISLLELGSFQLHKWISNNNVLLQNIKPENRYFDDINFKKALTITLKHWELNTVLKLILSKWHVLYSILITIFLQSERFLALSQKFMTH